MKGSLAAARQAFARGDLPEARRLTERFVAEHGPSSPALLLLARIAGEVGAHADARRLAEIGLALNPADSDCLAQRGYAAVRSGDRAAAHADARAVLGHTEPSVEALDLAGVIFHAIGSYGEAATVLSRAAAQAPGIAPLQANLGAALLLCGDIPGAVDAYRRAIALDPAQPRALAALSEARTASAGDNNVELIEAAIATAGNASDRLVLAHALARELESLGQFHRSFEALQRGKAAMKAERPTNDLADGDWSSRLAHLSCRTSSPRSEATLGKEMIFIVGMPRSGTTVVEQLLTGLPGIASLGESPILPGLVRRALGSRSPLLVELARLEECWDQLDFVGIGTAYLDHARRMSGTADRIVDKLPLNFLLCGVIAQALPAAKIVWVTRDPLETVLGNFRQMFEYASGSYDYNLSLIGTTRFVVNALELKGRFLDAERQRCFELRLEQLIAAPATTAKALTDFCGLAWKESCVAIEHNRRPVGSASAVQVREPINDRHLGRPARYGDLLREAIMYLAGHGFGVGRDDSVTPQE